MVRGEIISCTLKSYSLAGFEANQTQNKNIPQILHGNALIFYILHMNISLFIDHDKCMTL